MNEGTFSTLGVATNPQGQAQELSHASIFVPVTASQARVALDEPSLSTNGIFMLLAGTPFVMAMTKIKPLQRP